MVAYLNVIARTARPTAHVDWTQISFLKDHPLLPHSVSVELIGLARPAYGYFRTVTGHLALWVGVQMTEIPITGMAGWDALGHLVRLRPDISARITSLLVR